MRIFIVVMIAALLPACSGMLVSNDVTLYKPSHVVVSLRGPSFNPKDEADSFVIDKDTLYIASEWNISGEDPIYYRCEIYDGKGTLAFKMVGRIFSNGPFQYQSSYIPSSRTDAPGLWIIILYADDHVVAVKGIVGRQEYEIAKNQNKVISQI